MYYNQLNGAYPEVHNQQNMGGIYTSRANQPVMYVFLPPADSVITAARSEGATSLISRPLHISASDTAISHCLRTAGDLSSSMSAPQMTRQLVNATNMTGGGAYNGLFSINGDAADSLPRFDSTAYWGQPSFLLMIPSASTNVGAVMATPPTYAIVSGICSDWPYDARTGALNPSCRLIIGAGNYITTPAMSNSSIITGFVRSRNDVINNSYIPPTTTASHNNMLFDATPRTHVGGIEFEMGTVLGGDYRPGGTNAVAYVDNTKALNVGSSINATGAVTEDFNIKLADPVNNAATTMNTLLHGIEVARLPQVDYGAYDDSSDTAAQIRNVILSQINTHTRTQNHGTGLLDNIKLVQGETLTMAQLIGRFGDVTIHPVERGANNLGASNAYDNVSTIMGQCAGPIVSRIMLELQIASCSFTYQSCTNAAELRDVASFTSQLSIEQVRLKASQFVNALTQDFTPLVMGMGDQNYVLSGTYSASFGTTTVFKSMDRNDMPDPRGMHSPLFMGIIGSGTMIADRARVTSNTLCASHIFQALSTGMCDNAPVIAPPPQQYSHSVSPLMGHNSNMAYVPEQPLSSGHQLPTGLLF